MSNDRSFNTREPSSVYFTLDSNDRNDSTASVANITSSSSQPYNDFKLNKPDPLLISYTKRIGVTEINFPWFIPNITPRNNSFLVFTSSNPEGIPISIVPGFYTGTELASEVQTALRTALNDLSTVSYSVSQCCFTITPDTTQFSLDTTLNSTYNEYIFSPNLLKTMGIAFSQLYIDIPIGEVLIGGGTQLRYTSFVDICSSKLSYNTDMRDGSSNRRHNGDLIARLYCADETSQLGSAIAGQRPFNIYRQFRTPKYYKWNPDCFVDWLDIRVLDEYGFPLYIPLDGTAYPDFQITMVASEN